MLENNLLKNWNDLLKNWNDLLKNWNDSLKNWNDLLKNYSKYLDKSRTSCGLMQAYSYLKRNPKKVDLLSKGGKIIEIKYFSKFS